MEQSSLIKVVAAFVAGVVVALGSALIYVRVSDGLQPRAAIQTSVTPPQPTPTQLPDAGQDTSDQATEPNSGTEATQPPSASAPPVEHVKHHETTSKARRETPKAPSETPKAPLYHEASRNTAVEIAQNTPPPPPSADVGQQAPSNPVPELAQPQTQQQVEPTPAPLPDTAPSAPPPPQPHVVTLPSGMTVAIRLGETLSTDHNYTGDTFRATLEAPIVMDGFIIADKGSKVLGRVVNAQKAGHLEGISDLTLALSEINTTDGQRVKIESTTYDKRGPSNGGQEAAKIAGGAALGAIIGAAAGGGKGAAIGAGVGGAAGTGAVMATRGKPAVLPTETRLTFRLTTPVTITEKLNN